MNDGANTTSEERQLFSGRNRLLSSSTHLMNSARRQRTHNHRDIHCRSFPSLTLLDYARYSTATLLKSPRKLLGLCNDKYSSFKEGRRTSFRAHRSTANFFSGSTS